MHKSSFRNADAALIEISKNLLGDGQEVRSRVGMTKELTNIAFSLESPTEREITLEHRKANLPAQIAETMWVLAGRSDVAWLENYLPRAKDFSDDGEVWRAGYGPRIRSWCPTGICNRPVVGDPRHVDQLGEVFRILKADPSSRRAVISIFDPAVDFGESKDIPCNNWLSFSNRLGRLDMSVSIRSNDLVWGWSGINQFEWSALQEILANLLGVDPGALHFNVTSMHAYDQHWSRLRDMTKLIDGATFYKPSPRFYLSQDKRSMKGLQTVIDAWFSEEQAIRTGAYGANAFDAIDNFPEPMMRSWLHVLNWWWNGVDLPADLEGTRIARACDVGMKRKKREQQPLDVSDATLNVVPAADTFLKSVVATHTEKDAAYGDSWKRRGEQMSILANIARKVDRLGGGETSDETQADTALDLFVYIMKYRDWLVFNGQEMYGSLTALERTNSVMMLFNTRMATQTPINMLEFQLKERFEGLCEIVDRGAEHQEKVNLVEILAPMAFHLAFKRWYATMAAGDDYQGADRD